MNYLMTANTKTKSKIEVSYPDFSPEDYSNNVLFWLPMAPLGGRGRRKGTLKELLTLWYFRVGFQFEPEQRPNGKWIVKSGRRGGRKITKATHEWATREEAELEFVSNFFQYSPAKKRAAYFNIARA